MNLVETLKELYMEFGVSTEPKKVGELDASLVKEALIKICDLYLEPGSRKFIKHIITAFYPGNEGNLIMTLPPDIISEKRNRCAILGIKIGQVRDIVKYYGGSMKEGQSWNSGLEHTLVDAKKGQKKRNCPAVPIEVRNATFGYISLSSNKYLSGEAMAALTIFVLDCIEEGDNDVEALTKPRKKLGTGQEDRTDKHNTNFAMKNLIGEEIIEKLGMIK